MRSLEPGPERAAHRAGPEGSRAFSLVELLVVIAILTVLLALLAPTLRQAKVAAKRAMCLSNMHQQHLAQWNYAGANCGRFPVRNEHSPDYQRQGGLAGSAVSVMRGKYLADTDVMICPLVAQVSSQPYKEYARNDWITSSGGYGGWDTDATNVYTAYMWMGGFTGGSYGLELIGSEPPPPGKAKDCTDAVAFITHRLNFYRPGLLHEIAHFGRGLFHSAVPYEDHIVPEMPVSYGDGHGLLHRRSEVVPRMTVGGNYPGDAGWPGTYLW